MEIIIVGCIYMGYIGMMENQMETIVVGCIYMGYIGINGK